MIVTSTVTYHCHIHDPSYQGTVTFVISSNSHVSLDRCIPFRTYGYTGDMYRGTYVPVGQINISNYGHVRAYAGRPIL